MAKQYQQFGDLSKLQSELASLLVHGPNDGEWDQMASNMDRIALNAAYLSTNHEEDVKLSYEYLSSCWPNDHSEQEMQRLKLSIDDVVAKRVPRPPSTLHSTDIPSPKLSESWASNLSTSGLSLPSREVIEQWCAKPSIDLSFYEFRPVSISAISDEPNETSAPTYENNEEPEEAALVDLSCSLPEAAISRKPILVSYSIKNKQNDSPLPLDLSMGTSDNFMLSGNKSVKLMIEPAATHTEHYVLYPLTCGTLNLPQLHMVAFPDDVSKATPLDTLIEAKFPATLLVLVNYSTLSSN